LTGCGRAKKGILFTQMKVSVQIGAKKRGGKGALDSCRQRIMKRGNIAQQS
jgi:hypothetical protein